MRETGFVCLLLDEYDYLARFLQSVVQNEERSADPLPVDLVCLSPAPIFVL